jgi:hypothetical protein
MANSVHWQHEEMSPSSTTGSRRSHSNSSAHSRSTAPTEESYRHRLPQTDTCYGTVEGWDELELSEYSDDEFDDARASVETYASTVLSEAEFEEEPIPEYEVPYLQQDERAPDAIPATPRDFGDLFPSSRPLSIKHDDSTIDGNMNLRIDVPIRLRSGKQKCMTLFHLRMHDLRSRDFSLRRYCRDSGREVCHSLRKYQKPATERKPALHRSFSNALATLRPNKSADATKLQRHDSGYDSAQSPDSPTDESCRPKKAAGHSTTSLIPTNTVKLEFSNYAHIDVKRRGAKARKRYEFEYWGHNYSWRRVARRHGDHYINSYHLLRDLDDFSIAEIVPVRLSTAESREETAKGGWIPPCTMRIVDKKVLDSADLADVVVSTGLIALVDDSIKQRFHAKHSTQILIPLTKNASLKLNMDGLTPKRLIDEVFHRAPRGANSGHLQGHPRRPATS